MVQWEVDVFAVVFAVLRNLVDHFRQTSKSELHRGSLVLMRNRGVKVYLCYIDSNIEPSSLANIVSWSEVED